MLSSDQAINRSQDTIEDDVEATNTYPLIQKMNQGSANYNICPQIQVLPPRHVQAAPSIGSAGNVVAPQGAQPIISNAEMAKIKKNQKSVKTWSTGLYWFAYFLILSGWVNLVVSLMFSSVIGQFIDLPIKWVNQETQQEHRMEIDSYGLSVICIIKAAGSFFLIKQGRATLKVFQPVLKEYKDAESGRTNGIRMSERKSAKMMDLTKLVKKLTYGMWLFVLVSVIYSETWMVEQVDRFIDAYYITKINPNATFAQEYINVDSRDDHWGPRWDDFDNDVFGDDDSVLDQETQD